MRCLALTAFEKEVDVTTTAAGYKGIATSSAGREKRSQRSGLITKMFRKSNRAISTVF